MIALSTTSYTRTITWRGLGKGDIQASARFSFFQLTSVKFPLFAGGGCSNRDADSGNEHAANGETSHYAR